VPLSIALALSAPCAFAQVDVAIVAAAGSSAADVRFTDVQAKLMGTGEFNSVTIINAGNLGGGVTPTLTELQTFDAIITWSNQTYLSADDLGNVLADYVDAGGGVVVAVFATSTTTVGRSLGGRFRAGGYEIIPTQGGNTGGAASLGEIVDPTHPCVQGVSTFIGGTTASRPTNTNVSNHGFKIALWSDGKTLIAGSTRFSNRIDLGMYPPSRDALATSWDPATDGARIMANALLATISPPRCIADVDDGTFTGTPDGGVTIDDLLYYLTIYADGNIDADVDNGTFTGTPDGGVTIDDLLYFLSRYEAGC
jgi:hypothetical protein